LSRIYVIGLGPGAGETMTYEAAEALGQSDVIIGYKAYTDLVRDKYPGKEIIESPMRGEIERCKKCLEIAKSGRSVALICSGDAGVYGMASPMLETAAREDFDDVVIIPGVTAALSGAAVLGAPIGHDFCVISLSDLLTPWEMIAKRLEYAAKADMCIVLYNPASTKRVDHLKRACKIVLSADPADRWCGYVRNIGREQTASKICRLSEMQNEQVDMFTTVFIGNSHTKNEGGRLITPRGYTLG